MLRIYKAPSGLTYRYEEGRQPAGYEPADAPKAQEKRRTASTKRRTARDKGTGDVG